ncbi:MAG: tRNA uridine-5-carboxymethylaminomethyl(34) synthesis GTPase MnmE [Flavobacteriaceae bacterium]
MLSAGTIVALSTPAGSGAIGVIRLSGKEALEIVAPYFKTKKYTNLSDIPSNSNVFGQIIDANNQLLDEVMLCVFRAPHSYTGEHVIEISCHGSPYIIQELLQLFIQQGAVLAQPGEYTLRAFLNKKMDLSQAEAVADLIASESKAAHQMAVQQMRGGYSKEIAHLRQQLLDFASLIALELDFSDEDVEFANRPQLIELLNQLEHKINGLAASFAYGSVLKEGVPVAIAGKPNAGKSSLLNALLNEDKAIVSAIEGTTRDSIEDLLVIDGIQFRFIDTAGLRETQDEIEAIGVNKALEHLKKATVILYVFDLNTTEPESLLQELKSIEQKTQKIILVGNKIDLVDNQAVQKFEFLNKSYALHLLSTNNPKQIDDLKSQIANSMRFNANQGNIIISNVRHHQALTKALNAIVATREGVINGLSEDLISIDLREAIDFLGEVTGVVSTEDLLGNVFANFCIGK